MKTIAVHWHVYKHDGLGRLVARCDEDHTLNSNVVRWDEPITASSDSWTIANAAAEINGAEIISVDHDGDTVYVHVSDEVNTE